MGRVTGSNNLGSRVDVVQASRGSDQAQTLSSFWAPERQVLCRAGMAQRSSDGEADSWLRINQDRIGSEGGMLLSKDEIKGGERIKDA